MRMRKAVKINACTGISIVVANMIGTGAFTSLGFQMESLRNMAVVLTLWLLGGVLALSGAFSYAEVGTEIKKSGGEYAFLSQIYHPVMGYLSGWISLTVGFAAPIALSVIAFTEYLPINLVYPKFYGVLLIAVLTLVHSYSLNLSSKFQNISTLLKIILILTLIVIGFVMPASAENAINCETSFTSEITSMAFAVSLIYVSYSYSGWNAATYIIEEFKNSRKALPIALIGGTFLVTILYTLLQYIFLRHIPLPELIGTLNIGTLAVNHMLGTRAAAFFGGTISLLLVSGISAMIWVGPRVTASIASEHYLWRYFKSTPGQIPVRSLWLQFLISAILLITGTFEQIMIYCGILLNLSSLLVVVGVFVLRRKKERKDGYRSPLFPFLQVLFILISLWMIGYTLVNNPLETGIGLGNLFLGLVTYFISCRQGKRRTLCFPTKLEKGR